MKKLTTKEFEETMKELAKFIYVFVCLGLFPLAAAFYFLSLGHSIRLLSHTVRVIDCTPGQKGQG